MQRFVSFTHKASTDSNNNTTIYEIKIVISITLIIKTLFCNILRIPIGMKLARWVSPMKIPHSFHILNKEKAIISRFHILYFGNFYEEYNLVANNLAKKSWKSLKGKVKLLIINKHGTTPLGGFLPHSFSRSYTHDTIY